MEGPEAGVSMWPEGGLWRASIEQTWHRLLGVVVGSGRRVSSPSRGGDVAGEAGGPPPILPFHKSIRLEGWAVLHPALWPIGGNALPTLRVRIYPKHYSYSTHTHSALLSREAPLTAPTTPNPS